MAMVEGWLAMVEGWPAMVEGWPAIYGCGMAGCGRLVAMVVS